MDKSLQGDSGTLEEVQIIERCKCLDHYRPPLVCKTCEEMGRFVTQEKAAEMVCNIGKWFFQRVLNTSEVIM